MVSKKKYNMKESVTNSPAMLTAIPKVDLGMELQNREHTEKAKRAAAGLKQE